MVLLLVDCIRIVKIPQGFTNAHALGVLSPRRKFAKILMSVRGEFATRMQSVVTPQGAFLVLVRRVLKAMATRNALRLTNAKLSMLRYCTHLVFFVAIVLSCGELSNNLKENLPVRKQEDHNNVFCPNMPFYAQLFLSCAGLFQTRMIVIDEVSC